MIFQDFCFTIYILSIWYGLIWCMCVLIWFWTCSILADCHVPQKYHPMLFKTVWLVLLMWKYIHVAPVEMAKCVKYSHYRDVFLSIHVFLPSAVSFTVYPSLTVMLWTAICLPRTQMTLVLIGKGLVLRGWPSKIEVIGVLGIYRLDYDIIA